MTQHGTESGWGLQYMPSCQVHSKREAGRASMIRFSGSETICETQSPSIYLALGTGRWDTLLASTILLWFVPKREETTRPAALTPTSSIQTGHKGPAATVLRLSPEVVTHMQASRLLEVVRCRTWSCKSLLHVQISAEPCRSARRYGITQSRLWDKCCSNPACPLPRLAHVNEQGWSNSSDLGKSNSTCTFHHDKPRQAFTFLPSAAARHTRCAPTAVDSVTLATGLPLVPPRMHRHE